MGAFYGTLVSAMEPAIQAAVLNVGGGSNTEALRVSQSFRPVARLLLGLRVPSLLNIGDPADVTSYDYNEQYPFRDQGVTVLNVPGAAALQEAFERMEWLQASGDPATYAPWLKWNPSFDASYKRVLFQIALGDQTVPNPANSLLIRAADGLATTLALPPRPRPCGGAYADGQSARLLRVPARSGRGTDLDRRADAGGGIHLQRHHRRARRELDCPTGLRPEPVRNSDRAAGNTELPATLSTPPRVA